MDSAARPERRRTSGVQGPAPIAGIARLYELTSAIAASSSLGEIYDASLRCLGETLGVSRAAILLLDHQGKMRFHADTFLSSRYKSAVEGHSPWAADVVDPIPVLVPDVVLDDSLGSLSPAILDEGIRALAFIPLVASGKLIGKFMLYYDDVHEFQPEEILAAKTIASQVAFAIGQHRARLQNELASSLLADRNQTIEALFRSTIIGVAELDPQGRFVSVNDRYCEIVGRSRQELLEQWDCVALTHEDDRPATYRYLSGMEDGEQHFTLEKRYVRPSGQVVWVSKNVSAIRNADGTLRGAIAVATDMTGRRLQEERVKASESRLRMLIETLGLAVYTTDAAGVITLFNREAVALWGRSPGAGERWCGSYRIFSPDGVEMPLSECPMAECIRSGKPIRGKEIIAERPDGKFANILPYPTPIVDDDGAIVGAVNVLVDITPLKQAEAGLQEALRAKDDFLGQISHELKNPVTQIRGYSDLLTRRGEELSRDDTFDAISEIRTQSMRVQRLIENMLVLSRVERGAMPETEPHLIDRLVQPPLDEFRQRFPFTRLDVELTPGLPPVETTASTVDQVLWNLLTNAQKYGPDSGPIHVRAWTEHDSVCVAVRDHGPGVPEDELARLTEPYFRSSVTAQHAAGLGLGLSVCRRLIESQNGSLWGSRVDGGGMEFGFRLPILAAAE